MWEFLGVVANEKPLLSTYPVLILRAIFVPVCPNEFSLNPVHDVLNEALDTEAGDSTPKGVVSATQVQGPILLIAKEKSTAKFVKLSEEIKSFNASAKLRVKRTNKHHLGARLRRSAEAEKEEKKMTIAVEFITISFETISYLTSRKRGCSAEITTDLVQGFTLCIIKFCWSNMVLT